MVSGWNYPSLWFPSSQLAANHLFISISKSSQIKLWLPISSCITLFWWLKSILPLQATILITFYSDGYSSNYFKGDFSRRQLHDDRLQVMGLLMSLTLCLMVTLLVLPPQNNQVFCVSHPTTFPSHPFPTHSDYWFLGISMVWCWGISVDFNTCIPCHPSPYCHKNQTQLDNLPQRTVHSGPVTHNPST